MRKGNMTCPLPDSEDETPLAFPPPAWQTGCRYPRFAGRSDLRRRHRLYCAEGRESFRRETPPDSGAAQTSRPAFPGVVLETLEKRRVSVELTPLKPFLFSVIKPQYEMLDLRGEFEHGWSNRFYGDITCPACLFLLLGFLRTAPGQHVHLLKGILALSIFVMACLWITVPENGYSGGGGTWFIGISVITLGFLPAATLWSAHSSGKFIMTRLARLNDFPTY